LEVDEGNTGIMVATNPDPDVDIEYNDDVPTDEEKDEDNDVPNGRDSAELDVGHKQLQPELRKIFGFHPNQFLELYR
jgi:hypothetical protein